jgi:DNA-binding LacI/PurR family transcriptional regulator
MLDRYPAGIEQFPRASWVVSKDQVGIEIAMDHLMELGHEEILFLAGPNGSSSSAARFEGYRRRLSKAGGKFSDEQVFLAGQDIESGRKAMTQALSEERFFSAVVAFNDSVALGAIDVLLQQGFRVPEEISVIGFGDGLLAANFRVPLTTIRVPQVDMGSAAVHLLLEIQQGHKVAARELPVELVVRQSTARCRTKASHSNAAPAL